jgi:hypothetical protein
VTSGSLDQPLAKLKRAAAHYRTIKDEFFRGMDRETWTGTLERHRDGLEYRVRAGEIKPIAPELPLIFGDAYFNLRAALDYLAYQMHVRHYRGQAKVPASVARDSAFPIFMRHPVAKGGLLKPTRDWEQIGNLGKRERTAISWIQPYQRRGDDIVKDVRAALADISMLNNIDKHRELHLARNILLRIQVPRLPPEFGLEQHPSFGITLESNAYVDTWTFVKPPPPEQMDIKPFFSTAIGIEPGGDRIEAIAHLGGSILAVKWIMNRFSHLFPPPIEPLDLGWVQMREIRF